MTSTSTYTQGFVPNDNSNPQQGAVYHHFQQQQQQHHHQQQQYQQDHHPTSKSQRSTSSANPNRCTSRDDRKLFVGGLPSNITSKEFETFFQQFGTLVDSVVMFDRDTHRSRGFGFVTYEDVSVCHKLLMMGNEGSNPSDVMNLIGRIEMQGKTCEIKAATPRDLNGNRFVRRNNNNTNNTNNNDESKKLTPETSSSTAPNNKGVTSHKTTPSSFLPSIYAYPPIPPNQGLPTHFPHPNAFYYPPGYPVIPSAAGYLPPYLEYPGGYASSVPVGAYVENVIPNVGLNQESSADTSTFGNKEQLKVPDSSSAPFKSQIHNTSTIDKGVLPAYPPMIHTMGYPVGPATPTLLIPPIATSPLMDGTTPIPMTTTSAIPVVPDQIPYIHSSYGGMIPTPPLPSHPPFQLPAASHQIFRESDMYPAPFPYYPTAAAVAVGPLEPASPVTYGVMPPSTNQAGAAQKSEETVRTEP